MLVTDYYEYDLEHYILPKAHFMNILFFFSLVYKVEEYLILWFPCLFSCFKQIFKKLNLEILCDVQQLIHNVQGNPNLVNSVSLYAGVDQLLHEYFALIYLNCFFK